MLTSSVACTNPKRFETAYKSNQDIINELYNDYVKELREARLQRTSIPLHLFSKRVYCAYRNVWRIINRKLLTQEEIDIMLQLGIYKPTQTELGVRKLSPEERKERCKTRFGITGVSFTIM